MFLGAYWAEREESREESSSRVSAFLTAIASQDPAFRQWFLKAMTKARARVPLDTTPAGIAGILRVNRRDTDKQIITELGFSLGACNGTDCSISASVGCFSRHVGNSVVLSTSRRGESLATFNWRYLLEVAIDAFDPDHAVVTSNKRLDAARDGPDRLSGPVS